MEVFLFEVGMFKLQNRISVDFGARLNVHLLLKFTGQLYLVPILTSHQFEPGVHR
mgnify:CR=1 FL=1